MRSELDAKGLEVALKAFDADLFGPDEARRHQTASPYTVEYVQASARARLSDSIRAYLEGSTRSTGGSEAVAWQDDMDAAPKDGTRIILDWGGKARVGYYLDNSATNRPWQGWKVPSMEEWPSGQPTRWTPLPATSPPGGSEAVGVKALPEGFVLTDAMLRAFMDACFGGDPGGLTVRRVREGVRAMLAAAPASPEGIAARDAVIEEPDLATIEAVARKINPGRSEDHIKSVALDSLSILRALRSPVPSKGAENE